MKDGEQALVKDSFHRSHKSQENKIPLLFLPPPPTSSLFHGRLMGFLENLEVGGFNTSVGWSSRFFCVVALNQLSDLLE